MKHLIRYIFVLALFYIVFSITVIGTWTLQIPGEDTAVIIIKIIMTCIIFVIGMEIVKSITNKMIADER